MPIFPPGTGAARLEPGLPISQRHWKAARRYCNGCVMLRMNMKAQKFRARPHWTGFVITPESVEFWTQREFRLHDRILYCLEEGEWTIQRLNP